MSVKVFKSTDTNAPQVGGWGGALTDLLLACLVNGYGSVFATATITSNGTNVSNNDTVTIDGQTYTFKTALTPAANEVLIGASAAASLTNLQAAINLFGTSGTTYGASTRTPPGVYSSALTTTVLTLKARAGGTGGNSLAISKSAATLTLSASTLAGGSGSDTTTSAGWSNPYNGNGGQRVFRGGSGIQHYFHIDDASPRTTSLSKEADARGSEAATAFQTWTNPYPTTAQVALGNGVPIRQSATSDTTSRGWIVIADDRTAYGFILTGDTASTYYAFMLGEFYSLLTGADNYRSMVIGRSTPNSASNSTSVEQFSVAWTVNTGGGVWGGHYVARDHTGGGGSFNQLGHTPESIFGSFPTLMSGSDPGTGSIIVAPDVLFESSNVGNGVVTALRGRRRGMFGLMHTAATFGDGDTVVGSGAYIGRTFLVVKNIGPNATAFCFDITGPWETN